MKTQKPSIWGVITGPACFSLALCAGLCGLLLVLAYEFAQDLLQPFVIRQRSLPQKFLHHFLVGS